MATPEADEPVLAANPAEVLALKAILLAVVAVIAGETEDRGGSAQAVVDGFADAATQAVDASEITPADRADVIREEAKDQVRKILGGLRFAKPAPWAAN